MIQPRAAIIALAAAATSPLKAPPALLRRPARGPFPALLLAALVAVPVASRADTAPIPQQLLDRNPNDGLACRQLCYVFGANVAPPFRFVLTSSSPDQVRLDPAKLTGRNVLSTDPLNGQFSDPRVGASGNTVVIDYTGPDTIPAGTEICFTVTEDFFVGLPIPAGLQLDLQAKRLTDGFNLDVLGKLVIQPDPSKLFDLVAKGTPLAVSRGGGPNQEAGALQIVNQDGNPVPVANNLVVQVANNGFNVVQDPGNPSTLQVTVNIDPATSTSQNDLIANGGIKDKLKITFFDVLGNPLEVEEDITATVNNDLPEPSSSGVRRGRPVKSPKIALNQILDQLVAGDPISMATGAFFFTEPLLDLGGPLPLRFLIAYGSDSFPHEDGVALPEKFEHNHRALVSAGAGADATANITLGLGRELTFQRTGFGPWLLNGGEQITYTLAETGGHYLLVDPSENLVRVFKKTPIQNNNIRAHLVALRDRVGNVLTYTYDPAADPRVDGPAKVADGLGRELRFTYTTLGTQNKKFLTRVEDHTGRGWTFQYEVSPADNAAGAEVTLRSVTDPLGGVRTYSYAGQNRVAGVKRPKGNTPYTQTYGADDEANAVATQTDALGRTTTLAKENGVPGFGLTQRTLTNPDGSVERYFHNADGTLMSAMTDAAGHTMRFEPDGDLNRIRKTIDRDGAVSEIGYDPFSGNVASVRNARGERTSVNFRTPPPFPIRNPDNGELVFLGNTFADLGQIAFPDLTFRSYQRDTFTGLATRVTDRANDRDTFAHDFLGNVLTRTNGEGGVTTYTYDPAGNRASRTDSDTGTTTYAYDALNRLTQVTRPDGSTVIFTYDALDRLLTRTDERGTVTQFDYDPNSNLTAVTRDSGGALQQVTAFEYDALDRLVKVTDPASHQTLLAYPYHDKPESITLPDGSVVRFDYDARRALVGTLDEAGARTAIELDPAEQVRRITSPEKRTVTLERDALGAVTARVDHTGDRSSAELDVNNRPKAATDALGRTRSVLRDGEGRVTRRTEPLSGDTRYTYDDNGRLERLTDARGKIWNLTYTPMGRLDTVTDPNGGVWNRDYDTRGRLSQITYPGGVVETRVYDAESHLTARNFSDGLNLGYTFDALDRLTATASTPVALAYDTRDNLTTTTIHGQTFTATHDSRSRLATLDYAGQMSVTYTYDARGLVTRVTDSLSGAQVDIAYNADRQMTKVTRSNGVVTDYTYDAEGKIATIQHGALGTIGFTFNAANEPTAITDTAFPVDGSTALTSASTETQTFDNAGQLTGGGHAYDPRGRPTTDGTRTFTWDSADRLTQVVNGADTVAYDYTATGELAARTHNGQTTQFGYSYSVATRPILAERKAGVFTRFYVPLPNGRLLYEIELTPTPAARFYHFGKVGETRLLTDAAGAVTDAYAYDAHGRLLARTGSSDQIYAFVGELGVRDDPAAGLIHMRARHYDPKNGRFLSRDPIFLALMGRNSQSANPYHYVEGMPTWVTDPSGLDVSESDRRSAFDSMRQWANEAAAQREADGPRRANSLMPLGEAAGTLGDFFGIIMSHIFDNLNRFDDAERADLENRLGSIFAEFKSNPDDGVSREAKLEFASIRQKIIDRIVRDKAAAKALIRRALGGFLRFVPLGGQEVESGEEEAIDELDDIPPFQDDVKDREVEPQSDIS